jgi:hypothetical protein
MQIIKYFLLLLIYLLPVTVGAQATYLNQGAKEYFLVDRMEIKQQTNTNLNFSNLRPFNRKFIVQQTEFLDSARMGYTDSFGRDKYKSWTNLDLSRIDEYNLRSLLMNNSEWVTTPKTDFASKRKLFGFFYENKANFYEKHTNDFFVAINPVLQFTQSFETGNRKNLFLNSRGVTARGLIGKNIGFNTSIIDNQERGPDFYTNYVNSTSAVPGVGFYKDFKANAFDYFDARGTISVKVSKEVDLQFGHDKNFIGSGYRSLFLSDWGNSYLFLKLNTRVWKLNYQNLFMELTPQFAKGGDSLLPKKYAAMHHLSMNVTKWLNIGLFEGVIFSRKNSFELQYLNPIIFYRHIEGGLGSPDNAMAGMDFKANIAQRVQVYGQFLLDEFILSNIKNNPSNWTNKFGMQTGFKWVDIFGIPNLDIQGEYNRVRPFTYSRDSVTNYSHYNQPLAHPLGANFTEGIFMVRYQPAPKWYVNFNTIMFKKGVDSANVNFGGNILRRYTDRLSDNGFAQNAGRALKGAILNFGISYEARENIYIDFSVLHRRFTYADNVGSTNTTLLSAGVRINMYKRQYDY